MVAVKLCQLGKSGRMKGR